MLNPMSALSAASQFPVQAPHSSEALPRKSSKHQLQHLNRIALPYHLTHVHVHTVTMAKDETREKKEKKEKKDKKRKSSALDEADITMTSETIAASTPAKKEKKDKKRKSTSAVELDAAAQAKPGVVDVDEDGDVKIEEDGEGESKKVKIEVPLAALVPFANPLCDEKSQKKVLKGVKKGKPSHSLGLHAAQHTVQGSEVAR